MAAADVAFCVADGGSIVAISSSVLLPFFPLHGDLSQAVDWRASPENKEVGSSLGRFFPWGIALA